jgi:hypothetical protein
MINRILRYCSTLLSIFFFNELKNLKKKHEIIAEILKKKINRLDLFKSSKLQTHQIFSKKVYDLIIQDKTFNFLRDTHIQNIFFIHNRLFILKELCELQKDKNKWNLWKKLLIENSVGDPIRYFLYPKSSGNRIRQVYHLKKYFDYSKINLFRIKYILEIGGGYGCMAQIFKKINKNCTYVIFDTPEVNLLQYYYLQMNKIPVVMNKIEGMKVCLINKLTIIKKFNNIVDKNKSSLFIANWSISEMPIKLRDNILNRIKNFDYSLISFQEKFENINNINYFLRYKKKINKKCLVKIEKLKYYKKNFLNKSNHFYFFSKSK